jgi:hypothetical protein
MDSQPLSSPQVTTFELALDASVPVVELGLFSAAGS